MIEAWGAVEIGKQVVVPVLVVVGVGADSGIGGVEKRVVG